jgi:hypothetical protein
MRTPELILGCMYYICDTLYRSRYVRFTTQFDKNKQCRYTDLNEKLEPLYYHTLPLSVFNRSIVIPECDFDKYPNLIKFPSIDLNYSQIVSYRREILLNKLLNEDS